MKRICENCSETFEARKSDQKYCSEECYERPSRAHAKPYHAATHDEIAAELGCSRALVQRIEKQALAKLKRHRGMREYL